MARTVNDCREARDTHCVANPNIVDFLHKDWTPSPVAALVLRAAKPWSPKNHELFPKAARERAVALLLLGYRLSHGTDRFAGVEGALFDVWRTTVMSFAVTRGAPQQVDVEDAVDLTSVLPWRERVLSFFANIASEFDIGLTVLDAAVHLANTGNGATIEQVTAIVQDMTADGYLYSTIDDDHFHATEGVAATLA